MPKATAAKLKLEHYYKVSVEAAIERNKRYVLNAIASILHPSMCKNQESFH